MKKNYIKMYEDFINNSEYKFTQDKDYKFEVKVKYAVGNGETRNDSLFFKNEETAKEYAVLNNTDIKQSIYRGESK